jgi:hypothetical protein
MRETSKKTIIKYKKGKNLHLSPEEQAWAENIRKKTVGFKEIQQKIKKEQEEKTRVTNKLKKIKLKQIEEKKIKTIKIEKISTLFQEYEGVAIESITETLEMSRKDFFDFLIENNKILGEIRISEGKMFITNQKNISEFIKILDDQFKKWEFGKKSEKIEK